MIIKSANIRGWNRSCYETICKLLQKNPIEKKNNEISLSRQWRIKLVIHQLLSRTRFAILNFWSLSPLPFRFISFLFLFYSFLFFFSHSIDRVFRLTLIYSYARDRLNHFIDSAYRIESGVMTSIQFLIENFNFNFNSLLSKNIKLWTRYIW